MCRLLLCVVVVVSSVNLQAADAEVTLVNIGFDFVAAGRKLPAGEYYLWQREKDKVVMWSVNGPHAIELFTATIRRLVATDEAKVFFVNQDGRKSFWRFFPTGATTGIEISVPGAGLHKNADIPRTAFIADKASILGQSKSRDLRPGTRHTVSTATIAPAPPRMAPYAQ